MIAFIMLFILLVFLLRMPSCNICLMFVFIQYLFLQTLTRICIHKHVYIHKHTLPLKLGRNLIDMRAKISIVTIKINI